MNDTPHQVLQLWDLCRPWTLAAKPVSHQHPKPAPWCKPRISLKPAGTSGHSEVKKPETTNAKSRSPSTDLISDIYCGILSFYLAFCLTFCLAFLLAFELEFQLAYCLTFHLAFRLTFHLAFYLTFHLAFYLTFHLAIYLAFYLTLLDYQTVYIYIFIHNFEPFPLSISPADRPFTGTPSWYPYHWCPSWHSERAQHTAKWKRLRAWGRWKSTPFHSRPFFLGKLHAHFIGFTIWLWLT